ncbi:MAG TPA: YbjN domain-containing protein [Thermoleophilaceae bacterium]|nr:YbjN domain-containing protein [Thermoleophilaceae bacterium]
MAAVDVVDEYVSGLPGETRRLAHSEWGITVPAEQAHGWPLEIGMRVADGLLRVQAFALAASDELNPWNFLHWNRQTRHVRFACTRSGDIWVHGDLPAAGLEARAVDQLLGLVVEGALAARQAAGGGQGAVGNN